MSRPAVRDAAIAVAALVLVTLIAELFGATNLGTALTFGAIAFMLAIVVQILLRRDERVPAHEPSPAAAATPSKAVRKAPPPPPRKRRR